MNPFRDEAEFDHPASLQELADRRGTERTRTIYRLVHIEHGGDQGLARCRNISDGGVALHSVMPMELNEEIAITFSPTVRLTGTVAWANENKCGVKLARPIDSQLLLSRTSVEARTTGARPPRLNADLQGRVGFEDKAQDTTILDISQRGAKLTHGGELTLGLKVRVALCAWLEREGVVRWAKDKVAGIYFPAPLSVDDLGSVNRLRDKGRPGSSSEPEPLIA